jgi:hypothetical protein
MDANAAVSGPRHGGLAPAPRGGENWWGAPPCSRREDARWYSLASREIRCRAIKVTTAACSLGPNAHAPIASGNRALVSARQSGQRSWCVRCSVQNTLIGGSSATFKVAGGGRRAELAVDPREESCSVQIATSRANTSANAWRAASLLELFVRAARRATGVATGERQGGQRVWAGTCVRVRGPMARRAIAVAIPAVWVCPRFRPRSMAAGVGKAGSCSCHHSS